MICPSCGTAVLAGQRFCTECGASLPTVVAPAPAAPASADAAVAAGTVLPPPTFAPPSAGIEPTAAFTIIEQTSPTGFEPSSAWDAGATTPWPEQSVPATPAAGSPAVTTTTVVTSPTAVLPEVRSPRATALLVVATVAGGLAVASAFVDVASYEVVADGGATVTETYRLNDFSTNNLVGAMIAAVLLIGGAALGATRRRVGTGLAGGAGLAFGGLVSMMVGMVIALFDSTEVALLSSSGTFTLTTTYEVGFFLAVAGALLGGVVFVLSLWEMDADGRPPGTAAIGVLGVLGTLAVVVGTSIPQHGASFADNFSQPGLPPATLFLRLLVLLLILVGGLLGFVLGRRWGVGLALGAISVGSWQWLTAITESGDLPLGIAGGNFFLVDPDTQVIDFQPHLVTTIGVVVMVVAAVAGLLAAAVQRGSRA